MMNMIDNDNNNNAFVQNPILKYMHINYNVQSKECVGHLYFDIVRVSYKKKKGNLSVFTERVIKRWIVNIMLDDFQTRDNIGSPVARK